MKEENGFVSMQSAAEATMDFLRDQAAPVATKEQLGDLLRKAAMCAAAVEYFSSIPAGDESEKEAWEAFSLLIQACQVLSLQLLGMGLESLIDLADVQARGWVAEELGKPEDGEPS